MKGNGKTYSAGGKQGSQGCASPCVSKPGVLASSYSQTLWVKVRRFPSYSVTELMEKVLSEFWLGSLAYILN